jgi:hypothetical protein
MKLQFVKLSLRFHLLLFITGFYLLSCTKIKEVKYASNFEKHRDKVVVYEYKEISHFAQNNFQWGIKNLDEALILELCYGGTYDTTYHATLWNPLLGENREFEAWTDKKHPNPTVATGITNIHQVKKDGNEQAIVIFKTDYEWIKLKDEYKKDLERKDNPAYCPDGKLINIVFRNLNYYFAPCPTGIAIFEKDLNNIWVLTHFNRNVGRPGLSMFEPRDSVFQIGAEKVAMWDDKIKNFAIDSTVTNENNYRNVSYFRNKPIWAINFHEFSAHSNSDYEQNSIYIPMQNGSIKKAITLEQSTLFWRDLSESETYRDTKVTYDLIGSEYTAGLKDILVHRTGLDYDESKEKSFKVNQKILYQYDSEKGEYIVK